MTNIHVTRVFRKAPGYSRIIGFSDGTFVHIHDAWVERLLTDYGHTIEQAESRPDLIGEPDLRVRMWKDVLGVMKVSTNAEGEIVLSLSEGRHVQVTPSEARAIVEAV